MASPQQSPCLNDQTLAAFLSGELDEPMIERVEAHLESCEDCQIVVAAAAGCRPTTLGATSQLASLLAAEYPRIGDTVAERYRIEHVLGQGGMGVVYAARQLQLDQLVAIKVLRSTDPSASARFLREAKICARLTEEHLPRVFDVGRLPSGVPYFAMEHLAGEDLSKIILRGAVPVSDAIELIHQACTALAEAHAAGVVHRDLKPSNLFVVQRPDGKRLLKVLDFGISKLITAQALGTDTDLTQPHVMLGSPQYMSPEQVRASAPVDARSDIWSLGVILYELLAGRRPFCGATVPELFISIATEMPQALSELVTDLPAGVDAVVRRCLEKDRAHRFASVTELMQALRGEVPLAAAESSGSAYVGGDSSTPTPQARRSRWWPAAAVLLALAALLASAPRVPRWSAASNGAPASGTTVAVPPPVAAPSSLAIGINPFLGAELFVKSEFVDDVGWSINAHPELAPKMEQIKQAPTAYWVISADGVDNVETMMSAAEEEAHQLDKPTLPVFVLLNLPDRRCRRGVLTADARKTPGAIERYVPEFIEPLARVFAAHPEQRAAIILEPGALSALAARERLPCADSPNAQLDALSGALERLSLPNVFTYLEIGAAPWACDAAVRSRLVDLSRQLLSMGGATSRVRGFATNVGTYSPLQGDSARRFAPHNPCGNELDFVEKFSADLAAHGLRDKGFIVDTSRNGRDAVSHRGHYCNLAAAGLGERPRAAPRQLVDAYYWIKPPGESDGTNDRAAPYFNPDCDADCSLRPGPQGGRWFDAYFVALVRNANPPL